MRPLHLWYVVLKHGPRVAAALFLLTAAGFGVAGWVYAHPPTTEVTDHTHRQTVDRSLSTRAVVDGETGLYRRGTTLENQPVYLLDASPNQTLLVETHLPVDDASAANRVELVYTASREGSVFWTRTVTLPGDTVRDGRVVATRTPVSMSHVLSRVESHRDELGDAATVSVGVRVTTEYDLGRYEGTLSKTHPVEFGPKWYAISNGTASRTHSVPVTRTVKLPLRDEPTFVVPLVVGVVALVAGALVVAVYYGRFGRTSSDELTTALHHRRYEEWISRGTLPRTTSRTVVWVDTLEDLVDVAIDTGERVIYDSSVEGYAVLHENVGYYHDATPERNDPN